MYGKPKAEEELDHHIENDDNYQFFKDVMKHVF